MSLSSLTLLAISLVFILSGFTSAKTSRPSSKFVHHDNLLSKRLLRTSVIIIEITEDIAPKELHLLLQGPINRESQEARRVEELIEMHGITELLSAYESHYGIKNAIQVLNNGAANQNGLALAMQKQQLMHWVDAQKPPEEIYDEFHLVVQGKSLHEFLHNADTQALKRYLLMYNSKYLPLKHLYDILLNKIEEAAVLKLLAEVPFTSKRNDLAETIGFGQHLKASLLRRWKNQGINPDVAFKDVSVDEAVRALAIYDPQLTTTYLLKNLDGIQRKRMLTILKDKYTKEVLNKLKALETPPPIGKRRQKAESVTTEKKRRTSN